MVKPREGCKLILAREIDGRTPTESQSMRTPAAVNW
jgi:hypothetical protein